MRAFLAILLAIAFKFLDMQRLGPVLGVEFFINKRWLMNKLKRLVKIGL
jgi:hypothetical protein